MEKTFDFEALKKVPMSLTEKLTEDVKVNKETDAMFSHTESQPGFSTQSNNNEFFTSEKTQTQPQQGNSLNVGELFPAKLVVELADNILSKLISASLTMVTGKKVPSGFMSANAKEKEMLEPALKSYLNSINFVMTPLNGLLVTVAAIYGAKGIEAYNITNSMKAVTKEPVINSEPKDLKLEATGRKPKIVDGKMSAYMRKKHGL